MCFENNNYIESLGYTYDEREEKYFKKMNSGLSIGWISDWFDWHYYLETGRLVIGDKTMEKLNADFKELKDDFNAFMNYLKETNNR